MPTKHNFAPHPRFQFYFFLKKIPTISNIHIHYPKLIIVNYFVTELVETVRSSYQKPPPNVMLMQYQYDVKKWMQPCMGGVHNLSTSHCFKFTLDGNGEVMMQYKQWCSDKTWHPLRNGDVKLLKVINAIYFINMLNSLINI